MLFSYNLLPLITKPTRITDYTSTLIDHIYTNAPIHNTVSGICLVDISDHLPVFCTSDVYKKKRKRQCISVIIAILIKNCIWPICVQLIGKVT